MIPEYLAERIDRALRLLERIAAGVEALAARPAEPAANEPEPALWGVPEVAAFLKCSPSKVKSYAADGRLPTVPGLGRNLRFDPDAIKRLARGENSTGADVVQLSRVRR